MKTLLTLILFVLISLFFNSCLKDVRFEKYTYYYPVYILKTEARDSIKSSASQSIFSPGKFFVQGNYIYLNETGKGIHIIDYSHPSSPKNVAFIPILGNINLAIKGNYLYADQYSDLLTIDITNPLKASLVNVTEYAFNNSYADTNFIISEWHRVDTMMRTDDPFIEYANQGSSLPGAESNNAGFNGAQSININSGGSMASFTILNEHLYTVSNSDFRVFTITKASKPALVNTVSVNAEIIETIYPFKNYLFLGCKSGVLIYDASNADNPIAAGSFGHITECDPVIAENNLAYATLRSGGSCMGENDELEVLNTTNISNPTLIKSYPFNNPRGLAKDGDKLFICDGQDGLKILNAADANNIILIKVISGFEANDVIVNNGLAIVVAADGLYFIDYSNMDNAKIISKI